MVRHRQARYENRSCLPVDVDPDEKGELIVSELELFTEAEAACQRIAALPERAVRDLKRVINRACHIDVEGAIELDTEATIRGFFDPGTAQRITQNRNKREQGSGENEG